MNQKRFHIIIGLMVCTVGQIALHFTKMPDFVSGSIMGFGIGIMILGFINPRRNTVS